MDQKKKKNGLTNLKSCFLESLRSKTIKKSGNEVEIVINAEEDKVIEDSLKKIPNDWLKAKHIFITNCELDQLLPNFSV